MSIRFWRRFNILPHVTLNISKTGISITIGRRGMHWTIGKRGNTASVGMPGTGISYRKHIPHPKFDSIKIKNNEDEEVNKEKDSASVLNEFK